MNVRRVLPRGLLLAGVMVSFTVRGPAAQVTPVTVTPDIPLEISNPADLADAANFAWNEFIALTWPARPQGPTVFPRGEPLTTATYGSAGPTGQVVWETFRHKVEVFPGQGVPNGYDATAPGYGFGAKPDYVYRANSFTGVPMDGRIPPLQGVTAPDIPPFNNLDEVTQIGLNAMYAGAAYARPMAGGNTDTSQDEKILFEAKTNQTLYEYAVQPRVLSGTPYALYESDNAVVSAIKNNSAMFLETGDGRTYPPPYTEIPPSNPATGSVGAIEIKAAWRRLNPLIEDTTRFYTAPVRYYVGSEVNGIERIDGFVDSNDPAINQTWGLVALHIIHKTPNAPAFVYATFGHIDNILDKTGTSVEEPDGTTKPEYLGENPFEPALMIIPSTPTSPQLTLKGAGSANTNSPQLYYHNLLGKEVIEDPSTGQKYSGPVNVNRRIFPIPPIITAANRAAHAAIRSVNTNAVWVNYRLVNVQARPLNLSSIPAGEEATYFLANEVVETNTSLQRFSGGLIGNGAISDYSMGQPITNMYFVKSGSVTPYNMGGCMGCHGAQGQKMGGDFSVLLARGRVPFPEIIQADEEGGQMARLLAEKYLGSRR